jgi:hypothetical protein
MANAEHYASTQSVSGGSVSQWTLAGIVGVFRSRADARRSERAVRDLSDHIKRDIGLNGGRVANNDLDAELRHIMSYNAW